MASGAELFGRFKDLTDSEYYIFNDTTRADRLMSLAYRNSAEKLLRMAPYGKEVVRELRHLFKSQITATPTSNAVLLSAFTGTMFWVAFVKAKFTVSGVEYYYEATPDYFRLNRFLDAPDIRHPGYRIVGDSIVVSPSNVSCTQITADYYAKPANIDTTSATDLGFDPVLDDLIVREAVVIATSPNRDTLMNQLSLQEQIRNN